MQDFKDIKIRMPKPVNLCARLRSDGRLIEAHRLAVEKILELLKGDRHDDPQEHQG